MKLSIGIVGLPNVGKSTLFKLITKQEVNIANYPFATIDPNIGIVPVPDERLEKLAKLSGSKKIIPAVVEFYDIAGLVKDASKGEGLGNQFLSHIREVSAVVEVVRCFESSEIIHVENKVDPSKDIDTVNTELILKDLETVEKRIAKLEGEARAGDNKKIKDFETVKKIRDGLNKNILAINLDKELLNEPAIEEMNLLTAKPQIYLLNESGQFFKSLQADYLISDLSGSQSVNELIKKAYKMLGLISFLTTGEDETRAWTIKKEAKAPEAAGAIHTDFENKFIRAEVINWEKLLEADGWVKAKQKGWIKIEGRDYEVQDGDVMEIRHS